MRSLLKWTLRALAMLILAAAVLGVWKREEITRLLAVNSLFAEEKIVGNFSAMDRLFLTVPMARGDGPVSPLPEGAPMDPPDGMDDWIAERAVTALVVLKDGEIRHESYHLDTTADRQADQLVGGEIISFGADGDRAGGRGDRQSG